MRHVLLSTKTVIGEYIVILVHFRPVVFSQLGMVTCFCSPSCHKKSKQFVSARLHLARTVLAAFTVELQELHFKVREESE